jgi:Kdo2-lipid IVA lauroyltransferase/acyltransferase
MNETVSPASPAPPKPARLSIGRKLRFYLETAGFFTVIGFFRLFGIDRASAIGGWIGRTLVAPTSASRRALGNLALAFPEKNASEIAVIIGEMWDNLGRVMAEYAHLDSIHATGAAPRIEVENPNYFYEAKARGKGIILLSAHFANWEIMPVLARDRELTGATVVRPTNNPYVNRWLDRLRARLGMPELISKGAQGTRRIFTVLRKGDVVLMLADQRASEGILVPFFGRDAQTTPAPAALALKLGCTLLPAWNERIGGARFRVRLYPPLPLPNTGDPDRDLIALTASINDFIEARIRERPGQWLWIHRRWVGEDALLRKRAQALSPLRGGTTSATSKRV